MIAIILSILFPGLGQIYLGKYARGIIMILLSFIPFAYPFVLIWSIIDIIRLNKQGLTPEFSRKEVTWAIVLLFVVIPLAFFLIISGAFWGFSWYSNNYIIPSNNLDEGKKIVSTIERYRKSMGQYPESIAALAKGNPVRKKWITDSWDEPYVYKFDNESKTFSLISKGKDKIPGTGDDVVFK